MPDALERLQAALIPAMERSARGETPNATTLTRDAIGVAGLQVTNERVQLLADALVANPPLAAGLSAAQRTQEIARRAEAFVDSVERAPGANLQAKFDARNTEVTRALVESRAQAAQLGLIPQWVVGGNTPPAGAATRVMDGLREQFTRADNTTGTFAPTQQQIYDLGRIVQAGLPEAQRRNPAAISAGIQEVLTQARNQAGLGRDEDARELGINNGGDLGRAFAEVYNQTRNALPRSTRSAPGFPAELPETAPAPGGMSAIPGVSDALSAVGVTGDTGVRTIANAAQRTVDTGKSIL